MRSLLHGAAIAVGALLAFAPPGSGYPASAASSVPVCTNSWAKPVSGGWFDASKWTAGRAPLGNDAVCITVDGTYTVTEAQDGAPVTVSSLQLGGTAGTSTLVVRDSCGAGPVAELSTTQGTLVGTHGVVSLTSGATCARDTDLAGPVTNAGLVSAQPGGGGERLLGGDFTNAGGVLSIATETAFDGTHTVQFENQGAVNLADGTNLELYHVAFSNDMGGSVNATGSGTASVLQGTFTQADGTTTGISPVLIRSDTLNYAGSGSSVIRARTGSTVSGKIAAGQTLLIDSTCCFGVIVTAASGFSNGGTLAFTDEAHAGDSATLDLAAGDTLANTGVITALPGVGPATIAGNVSNSGIVATAAGHGLSITGSYTQTAAGTLKPAVSRTPGKLQVGGAASVNGVLAIARAGAFGPAVGTTLDVLDGASVTGVFRKETGGIIDPATGVWFAPQLAATRVALRVVQPTVTVTPSSAPAGGSFTIHGTGFATSDTVKVALRDSAGTIATSPPVTADASGAFTATELVPQSAAVASGTVTATSRFSGLALACPFSIITS
jgi:hypothetical protein